MNNLLLLSLTMPLKSLLWPLKSLLWLMPKLRQLQSISKAKRVVKVKVMLNMERKMLMALTALTALMALMETTVMMHLPIQLLMVHRQLLMVPRTHCTTQMTHMVRTVTHTVMILMLELNLLKLKLLKLKLVMPLNSVMLLQHPQHMVHKHQHSMALKLKDSKIKHTCTPTIHMVTTVNQRPMIHTPIQQLTQQVELYNQDKQV